MWPGGSWMSGRKPGRVKGLLPRHSERGLKRTPKGSDHRWPVCGGSVGGRWKGWRRGRGKYAVEFEREWIARAIEQKQSVATECSTRTKEHRGRPEDKRLIFVFLQNLAPLPPPSPCPTVAPSDPSLTARWRLFVEANNVGFISSRALGLCRCRTLFPFNALLSNERLKRKWRFINRDSRV